MVRVFPGGGDRVVDGVAADEDLGLRDGVEGVTVKALESTVIEFKDFDSILVN